MLNFDKVVAKDNYAIDVTTMDIKPTGVVYSSNSSTPNDYTNDIVVNTVDLNRGLEDLGGQFSTLMPMQNLECFDTIRIMSKLS